MRLRPAVAIALIAPFTLAACSAPKPPLQQAAKAAQPVKEGGNANEREFKATAAPRAAGDVSPDEGGAMGHIPANLLPAVTAARHDLAARLKQPADSVEVIAAKNVTWPDGSRGCPQAGMAYTQQLVAGVQVRLRVNGALYHYHGGRDGALQLCENPKAAAAKPVPNHDI